MRKLLSNMWVKVVLLLLAMPSSEAMANGDHPASDSAESWLANKVTGAAFAQESADGSPNLQ